MLWITDNKAHRFIAQQLAKQEGCKIYLADFDEDVEHLLFDVAPQVVIIDDHFFDKMTQTFAQELAKAHEVTLVLILEHKIKDKADSLFKRKFDVFYKPIKPLSILNDILAVSGKIDKGIVH